MPTNSTSEPRELVETPDLNGAYPRLDEAGMVAPVEGYGTAEESVISVHGRGRFLRELREAGRHGGRRGRDGHQPRLRKNPAGIAGRRIPGREAQ